MARHILVPMDDSEASKNALRYALSEYPDAELTVLHVLTSRESVGHGEAVGTIRVCNELAQKETEQLFTEVQVLADEFDIKIKTVKGSGPPSHTVINYTNEHDIDHIIMGSHGRSGIKRLLYGSVSEIAVRHTSVPITVVPSNGEDLDENNSIEKLHQITLSIQ